jgi:putative YhdH/YhfP family quinone oxidoreductase
MPEAMTIGTAGFTAAQAALRFQEGDVTPDSGPILVTGASGGVGSCAVALLSHLGYEVVPASRNPSKHDAFFQRLGAKTSCSTESINEFSPKPLLKSKWGGVVDTVGGKLLENAIKSTHRRGTIAFCGMIASSEINTTVFPFILRGIRLVGIDSAECPLDQKKDIWKKLSGPWKAPALQSLMELHPWESIPDQIEKMKSGNTQGRIVFKIR